MNVGEIMTPISTFVDPSDPLSTVVTSMRDNRQSCTLVSRNGTPLGILTERDIVRVYQQCLTGQALIDRMVGSVMTRDPICLTTTTPLHDALVLSRSHRVRHFPVLNEQEKLVGVVTQTDMVNAYLVLMEQKAGLERENEELKLLLHEDTLMKIGNRRAMEVELEFTEATARRYNKRYAVALLDVDWFGKYNNLYGHQMGDKTLLTFASRVKDEIRESDRVFRYGGEEVLLLMPDTVEQEAVSVAESTRQAIEAMNLPHQTSQFGILTLSIGVALGGQEPWRELVKRADAALFQAKELGRNRVVAHSQH